jgi:hypothetical protein
MVNLVVGIMYDNLRRNLVSCLYNTETLNKLIK